MNKNTVKNIPFLDLHQTYLVQRKGFDNAWRRIMKRGLFILGPELKRFEQIFAKYIDARWAVGVANGTDAIELALRALQIHQGDEVITTPLTAMPTLMAIASTGATIRLADVSKSSGLINPQEIEQKITKKTRAIVPVHLYGQVCDMQSIGKIAKKYKISVVEDCAQAHGALYKNKSAGSFGDLAAWSFYPTKNLGAFGDAGAVSGKTMEYQESILALRNYGQKETYNHVSIGRNSRLDELQAAILSERLRKLDEEITIRRTIAHRYHKELSGKLTIISGSQDTSENKSSYHLFVVVTPYERNLFRERLQKKGVGTLVHYPIPAHKQKAFTYLGYKKGDFPHSEFLADHVVSLPLHPYLREGEIQYIIDAVKEIT